MNRSEYIRMSKLEETHWWFVGKRNFINTLFPKVKEPKILDIGAGTGGTTKFFAKYGKVFGLEKSAFARKLAKSRGMRLKRGDAGNLPFKKDSFDIVTILDVLYHKDIQSDVEVINEAYRVLRRHGYLIVSDSAFNFLRSSHDRAVKTRHRYTRFEIVQIIQKAGFKVERASYIFFFVFPLVLTFRLLTKLSKRSVSDLAKAPVVLNDFLVFICVLEAKLVKYFDMPIGSSILVRASKI